MLDFISDQMDALDDLWVRPEEYIEEDRLVPIRWGGRAKEAQIEVEFSSVHVHAMREGKAVRVQMYEDMAQAHEAGALRE
jgi:ketosteroid isomerase-like protein